MARFFTPENIDKWRIWPRMLITLYGVAFYRTIEWFMALPEPNNAQSMFVSVIVGAGAAWFGLYVNSGATHRQEKINLTELDKKSDSRLVIVHETGEPPKTEDLTKENF